MFLLYVIIHAAQPLTVCTSTVWSPETKTDSFFHLQGHVSCQNRQRSDDRAGPRDKTVPCRSGHRALMAPMLMFRRRLARSSDALETSETKLEMSWANRNELFWLCDTNLCTVCTALKGGKKQHTDQ